MAYPALVERLSTALNPDDMMVRRSGFPSRKPKPGLVACALWLDRTMPALSDGVSSMAPAPLEVVRLVKGLLNKVYCCISFHVVLEIQYLYRSLLCNLGL